MSAEPTGALDTGREAITAWCREYLAGLLGVAADRVDPDTDFDRLGVDSALAVSLLIDIEERYGVDVPPEALFENPTIRAVAEHVHTHAAAP